MGPGEPDTSRVDNADKMDTNTTFNTTSQPEVTTTLTTWSTEVHTFTDDFDPFFHITKTPTFTHEPTPPTINHSHLGRTYTPINLLPYQNHINKYATLFFVIIGMPSNMLCFILWRKPDLWNVSGLYMVCLAISDFLALFLNLLKDVHLVWEINVLDNIVLCYTFPLLLSSIQQLSTYFNLGFTVERYISVFYPFQRNVYCTEEHAKICVIIFVVFCFLLNSPQTYFWFMETYTYEDTKVTITYCALRSEVDQGVFSTYNIYVYVAEGISFGLVSLIVLILDGFLLREMIRLNSAVMGMRRNRKWKKSSTTFTLLTVSVFQIITTLPDTFAKSLHNLYEVD
ncbi:neuropeptide FF receptor 2-like, partial [Physella acuta]|uniref:neuropeptide FF receptor 2-like n=1 Tax=Physella acuta TaxID=109671 RepID=UPI0027DE5762